MKYSPLPHIYLLLFAIPALCISLSSIAADQSDHIKLERKRQDHRQFQLGETPQNPRYSVPKTTTPPQQKAFPAPNKDPKAKTSSESSTSKKLAPTLNKIMKSPSLKKTHSGSVSTSPSSTAAVSPKPKNDPSTLEYRTCKLPENKVPRNTRRDVYSQTPYQPGEKSKYQISYLGVHAGSGTVFIDPPILVDKLWHQVIRAEAKSGDWYKYIYLVKDKLVATSRPWDSGIRRFFMEQDEGTLFGKKYVATKWLDFNHAKCTVIEKLKEEKNSEKTRNFELHRGGSDVLSAIFNLRKRNLRIGKVETMPIYTSEKNWLLEAHIIAQEQVTVPAGKFLTYKIKLKTFIGKDLQQKGDVHIWLSKNSPQHEMIQVKADVKVGSFWLRLEKYTSGQPL
jgi:hypothetical protein